MTEVNDGGTKPPQVAQRPPTPLWVKLFGVAFLLVLALLAFLLLMGGEHGPGQHL